MATLKTLEAFMRRAGGSSVISPKRHESLGFASASFLVVIKMAKINDLAVIRVEPARA